MEKFGMEQDVKNVIQPILENGVFAKRIKFKTPKNLL